LSIRIQRMRNNVPDGGTELSPDGVDVEFKETTVDGYTFAWGPGQVRNFLDDGVGVAHGAFDGDEDTVLENGVNATNGASRA